VTAAHFIYIPMILIVGTVLGFILGGRAARDSFAMDQKNQERRAAARAEREARIAAAKPAATEPAAKPPSDP
jgi:hypothetical protein